MRIYWWIDFLNLLLPNCNTYAFNNFKEIFGYQRIPWYPLLLLNRCKEILINSFAHQTYYRIAVDFISICYRAYLISGGWSDICNLKILWYLLQLSNNFFDSYRFCCSSNRLSNGQTYDLEISKECLSCEQKIPWYPLQCLNPLISPATFE